MISPIIKNFETPDEIREFEKGRFELVEFPNMTIGKATYDPGWKWSKDGTIHTVKKGDVFYVPPEPHDSWVLGDQKYVSIHFLGADKYAD